ncbi:hypothetical protein MHYMCMPASI_00853 [Hyalomma marginatum]|uniref:Uncharacterized protein n=1 Tax=Hyalomma marginatum TaxID=34627 RepID=A0A8S4BWS5_9ACAR|nr:hypothetical protein MHYMCMPASI_00853 [Hyalomma marginatum]
MISHKFKEDFGFLQSEVDKLITKFSIGQEVREKIQQCYNGYSTPADV